MTSPDSSRSALLAENAQGDASSSPPRKRSSSQSPSPVSKAAGSPSVVAQDHKEADESAEDGTQEDDAKRFEPVQDLSRMQAEQSVEGEPEASTSRTQAASADKATQAEGHPWQAVWSPPHNAYYFWNSQTNTTTWVNPLQEEGSSSATGATSNPAASTSALPQQQQDMLSEEDLARQAGIDPELAHLDPALYASQLRMAASSAATSSSTTLAADRDPQARFSQTSKAKRQMSAYFDVEAWEQQREAEHAAQAQALAEDSGGGYAGTKRGKGNRHPSKKEVQEFKERKRERKKAKLGWLHS